MIVKVQVPLMTSEEIPLALIYNEKRSVEVQVPINEHIKKKMDGSFKQFFHLNKLDNGKVELGKKAPWQEW